MALGRNVIANYVGRAWGSLLAILLIPVYKGFLGIEAYGLISFFATLGGVLVILDLGIGATLTRELARLSAIEGSAHTQRNLVRTFESLYWGIALIAGVMVFSIAPFLATHWIQSRDLSSSTVLTAVRLMGVAVALQFPFSLYQGGLMGLQRQVLLNGILVAIGTIRGLGAVVVLWLVSPTIQAFFIWNLAVSLIAAAMLRGVLSRCLPKCAEAARFTVSLLRENWRYAAAISANAVIGISMTQLDKVILSGMLTLDLYGYYGIASQVASGIWSIIVPFNTAVFPRFVQLYQSKSEPQLRVLFHRTSQLLSAILFPLCALLVVFASDILRLWMRDPLVADNCHLIVSCLVFGTMLNGIASLPGYTASAFGWPGLVTRTNLIQVGMIVPLMLVFVWQLQGLGAAIAWIVLNSTYVIFMVPRFFRRYFRDDQWTWYVRDQAVPALAAFSITLASALLAPASMHGIARGAYLAATLALAIAATVTSLPHVRALIRDRVPSGFTR